MDSAGIILDSVSHFTIRSAEKFLGVQFFFFVVVRAYTAILADLTVVWAGFVYSRIFFLLDFVLEFIPEYALPIIK